MLKNHEIVVKIVIGNSMILKRSKHWQLNSYSFVFELPTEFGNAHLVESTSGRDQVEIRKSRFEKSGDQEIRFS